MYKIIIKTVIRKTLLSVIRFFRRVVIAGEIGIAEAKNIPLSLNLHVVAKKDTDYILESS